MSEPESTVEQPTRHKGIYLLPNLFTTAAVFAGFYAIVAAMKGQYEHSAAGIFVAMLMDTLDGRVARLTKTQSAFGAEYDSLSDMVSFGLAPSLVSYNWALADFGKLGWLAAFIYTAATALRLARFNIQIPLSDKRFFIGLPCPAAAAVIGGLVWFGTDLAILGRQISIIVALILLFLGLLMVSNIKYYSFKEIDFKGHVPFFAILLVVFLFSIVAWDPPSILFTMFFCYALSGPILWIKNRYRK